MRARVAQMVRVVRERFDLERENAELRAEVRVLREKVELLEAALAPHVGTDRVLPVGRGQWTIRR